MRMMATALCCLLGDRSTASVRGADSGLGSGVAASSAGGAMSAWRLKRIECASLVLRTLRPVTGLGQRRTKL
jgi:hypothetical protein